VRAEVVSICFNWGVYTTMLAETPVFIREIMAGVAGLETSFNASAIFG